MTQGWFRNALLALCVALPWLNPFTSSPSTSVTPLLLSWMMAASALLLVVDQPHVASPITSSTKWLGAAMGSWLLAELLWVPEVVDRALTLGLFASLLCVALMAALGRRAVSADQGLMPWVAGALLFAALGSSVLGVLQYLDSARDLSPWVNQPAPGDAFANLRQRNQFASLTSVGLVVLLSWFAARGHAHTWRRLAAWTALHLLAAGVACSQSRTGALQWVLVGMLGAAWAWRQPRQGRMWSNPVWRLALAAPVLMLLWSACMPWLAAQVAGHAGTSVIMRVAGEAVDYGACGSRRVLWGNAWHLIVQRPWLGWGWGETDFAHFITAYPGERFCDMLDNAHNLPLHLALELGLPFATLVLACAAVWVWRRAPWREREAWRTMAWGVLLVVGVHSLLEYPLWYGPFQMVWGLALGMLWDTSRTARDAMLAPVALRVQNMWLALATLLFLGCLYAAWDFNRIAQIYRPPALRVAPYSANPMAYAKQSWLFRNQVEFADLTMQTVTPQNAAAVHAQAEMVMHYSPEPRVVERLIDSAKLLGLEIQADFFKQRLADVVKTNAH